MYLNNKYLIGLCVYLIAFSCSAAGYGGVANNMMDPVNMTANLIGIGSFIVGLTCLFGSLLKYMQYHVKSLADNVITSAKKNKVSYLNSEGENEGEWVIVDMGDIIVHVMLETTRKFYNLEDLWEPIQKQREQHR